MFDCLIFIGNLGVKGGGCRLNLYVSIFIGGLVFFESWVGKGLYGFVFVNL